MTSHPDLKPRRAWGRALALALLVVGAVTALALSPVGAPVLARLQTAFAPRAAVGGPFSLVDQTGARRTEKDFAGRPLLIFFGFTHCPDVCPTTLTSLGRWLEALGPDAHDLAPLFVTVDPERDTPPVLADYLKAFDPRIVGLTGTPDEVAHMLRAYRAFARKTETGDFEHTAALYVMGRKGELVQLLGYDRPDAEIVVALRKAVAS
ncbi:MAG: SCO family protein [Hyphomicrobiaceae bacterium]